MAASAHKWCSAPLALGLLLSAAPVAKAAPTPTPTPWPTPTPPVRASPTPFRPPTPLPTPAPTATATPAPTPAPTLGPRPTATPAPLALSLSPTSTPAPAEVFRTELIGYSRQGRPLLVYRLGAGRRTAIVIGGIHAGTEANTAELVQQLLERARDTPEVLPPELTVAWLPVANPDGLMNGTRLLSNGVDPNRNWPTADWNPDTYESSSRGPEPLVGGGGPVPLSEPETSVLAAFVLRLQPVAVVSYHSAASLVMAGPAARALGLDLAYALAAGYRLGDWTAYPVTGDFAQWAEDQGIPAVEIELPDHGSTDLEANWGGLVSLIWAAFS